MKSSFVGVISVLECYSKAELLRRLGISQRFWDKMLDEGLPFTRVGNTRFVSGQDLFRFLQRNAELKGDHGFGTDLKGSYDAETT